MMPEIAEYITIKVLKVDSEDILGLFLGLNESSLSFYRVILRPTCHFDEVFFVTNEFRPVFSIILSGREILVPGQFASFIMDVLNVNGINFSHFWVNGRTGNVESKSEKCILMAPGDIGLAINMAMPAEKTVNVIIVSKKEPTDDLGIENLAHTIICPATEEKKGALPIKTIPKSCIMSDFLSRRTLSISCSHRRRFYRRQKK